MIAGMRTIWNLDDALLARAGEDTEVTPDGVPLIGRI